MKCIVGNGKQCLVNCKRGYACTNGIFVMAEGLDPLKLGAVVTGGR
jgi:hypothetical protein